jgi:hypothetical protein
MLLSSLARCASLAHSKHLALFASADSACSVFVGLLRYSISPELQSRILNFLGRFSPNSPTLDNAFDFDLGRSVLIMVHAFCKS